MELRELYSFSPNKFAYHLSQSPLILALHPSSNFLAFVTRANEVAFYNRKTGRLSIIWQSKHGIALLLFTEHYLIAIEKNMPEIFVFSVKAQKLKKKVAGHRSQVLSAAYCPQRKIFCTASHDVCWVWDEPTLNTLKMLKCSTSSYHDCHFTFNGQYLFTSFTDGNVFGWDLQTYNPKQYALNIQAHRLSSTCNQFICAYTNKKISVADFSQQSLLFEVIDCFWEGHIEHVDFVDNFILIKTTQAFYLAQITKEHRMVLKNEKELIDQIYEFATGRYSSEVVVVTKDLTKIRTMKIFSDAFSDTIPLTNPLLNPNTQCIGGYSAENGCLVDAQYGLSTYNYEKQKYKLEQLNDGIYHKNPNTYFSDEKVKTFIRKNYIFPDKYRAYSYTNSLQLPVSKKSFLELQKKGRHSCVKMLDNKYPLDNLKLSEAMKDILSLLAHYSPVFAQSNLIPPLIFPFVCLFGDDRFFCFQVLYRIFNNWLSILFVNFPLANSELLQNIQEIFQQEDQLLLNHLNQKNISFTKLVWTLLSTLLSTNLPRDGFLAVADTLVSHPEDPSFIVFMIIGYIEYNRPRIFSMKSEEDLNVFLEEQHTINISSFMKKAYELRNRLGRILYYPFRQLSFKDNRYIQYDCFPKHAVKMYEGKRRLEEQQFQKVMNEQRYHQEIGRQMENMVVKIKRQSDKAVIQSQAIMLQSENEGKNSINVPRTNISERKKKIKVLMSRLEEMVNNKNDKRLKVKEYIPLLNQLNQKNTDTELDSIEEKLMGLIVKLEPNSFDLPLNSQPMTFAKQKPDDFLSFKAAKRAQLTNKFWETDKMGLQLQKNQWEDNFQKALKY